MKYLKTIIYICIITKIFSQECPPLDTLSISPIQDLWDIPTENQWEKVEIMTWNIKNFPMSNNTINYVNEIITDIKPDIIAFQEMNNATAVNTLSNAIPAYEFISSGTGLVMASRRDVIEILSWSTLFPGSGYDFAWRYPLLVELSWLCGNKAVNLQVINLHLKSGSTSDDFNRRYASCELISNYISDNPNITIEIVEKYPDKDWDWWGISENPNITMEFVEKYLDKPWSWEYMSRNPNITMEFVEKFQDKPWNWRYMSNHMSNPNIAMEFIEKYPDKPWDWGWHGLSGLKFNKERERFILDKHRQYIRDHIKEELAMVAYHPLNIEKYLSMGYEIEDLDEIM